MNLWFGWVQLASPVSYRLPGTSGLAQACPPHGDETGTSLLSHLGYVTPANIPLAKVSQLAKPSVKRW